MAADITVIENPRAIVLSDTSQTKILMSKVRGNVGLLEYLIRANTGNAGTIKINGIGQVTADSPTLAAGESIIITAGAEFYAQASNANDGFKIAY